MRTTHLTCRLRRLCGAVFIPALATAAPVINEIHYHPAHAEMSPEPLTQEWIEIHNPDAVAAALSGWQVTNGVTFTFPAGIVIPGGGFCVVAANVPAFQAAHPGFNGLLTGGWTGQLSNSGETLRLADATGAEVDTINYADEGDWAIRGRGPVDPNWVGHQGWDWFTDADGLGKTKELINPALRKNTGQNWSDSSAAGGSPGAVNGVRAANVAPVILDVQHRPQIPRSTDPIRVSAKVTDDNGAAVTTTLKWRLDGAASWTSVAMTDSDGDADPDAAIPSQANLSIVEFHVEATDGSLVRTWPPPARTSDPGVVPDTRAQVCNALVQVDNAFDPNISWAAGAQPVYRLVMTAAERAELRAIGEGDDNQNRQIDAAMHATFISTDGTGQDTRYRCAVRNRGFSSRVGPPNNFSIGFVAGDAWEDRNSFQLNCRYPYAAVCSTLLFDLAGMPVQDAAGAQLRINGLNPATSGQGVGSFTQSITYSGLARIEGLGGDWASAHFPGDGDGNLYRADDHDIGNSGGSNRFAWPGSADPDLYEDIYRKQTNVDLNDYSDISALFQALNDAAATSAVFSANVRARANVDQWLTYIAVDSLVGNMEGGVTTGRSDDFSLYRGLIDQRFVFVPHDLDTTLGQNFQSGVNRSIFSHVAGGGNSFTGLVRMFNEPEFLHLYYRKNVELCNSLFNNTRLDPLFDTIMNGWVPAGTVSALKSFVTQRRTNVLNQIPQVNLFDISGVATSNPALVEGMKQTPDGVATFTGQFNVAQVQSVLLNGQAASLQWRTTTLPPAIAGRWSFAATAANGFLKRGVTRVQVRYFSGPGGAGEVVYSAALDVYNTSGTMTTVAANGTASTDAHSLFVEAPSTYIPGIPFLVEVEYRDAGVPDRLAWNRTATLTANNGVTLASASTGGGPATVQLSNGRGSLLVLPSASGGGATDVLLRGRGSAGAGAPATWSYYIGATAPPANWTTPAFVPPGWQTGLPVFFRNETGLTGTNIPPTSVGHAFRTQFNVTNPSQYASAKIRLQRDDGAIVYFNGTFLGMTQGMTQGMAWNAACTTNLMGADETAWIELDVPIAQIIDGTNTIAVEVHQTTTGTDMRFDLEMTGTPSGGGAVDPGNFTLTATSGTFTAGKSLTSLTPAPAMTTKSGTLPGSESWSGVVHVTGDVTVPAGATLTISPGTHVLVAGTPFGGGGSAGADLIVSGTLAANGTEANPISITCADAAARWGEITFNSGAPTSTLQHCLVSRACHSPGGGHTATGPIVRLAGNTLTLEDCVFADSPGKSMTNSGNANITIRRCHFARSVMGPELDGSAITIEDSHLTDMQPAHRESGGPDDEDCIYIDDSGGRPVNLRRTVMAHCGDDVLDCLGGTLTVEDCIIRNGFDKGVSLLSNNITMRRCLIVDNDIGISAKITGGQEATAFTNTIENCTIVCENHPLNTGDGTFHSIGCHTRNKNNTATANIIWNVRNLIISAEEPVANDYPTVGSTVFGGMNFTYSGYHDLGGANPANAVPAGAGNISQNPLYADATARDFRLQAASPCRDTGDPALTDPDSTRSDMGALTFGGTGITPTQINWTLAGSPYRVPQNVTIPAGTTLSVEPGVSIFFDQNVRLTLNGRMNAIGTANARIRFSHAPGTNLATDVDPIKNGTQTGAPKWGGVRVIDSLAAENRFAFCDFINAQGTDPATAENWGSLGFIRSWGFADSLTFAGTHLRMLYGRNCQLTVVRCTFPDMFLSDAGLGRIEVPNDFLASADNRMEPLKVEYPVTDPEVSGNPAGFPNGLPAGGHWRCYFNTHHGNRGHQDVFDADSGRWNQPGQFVLDCRYNNYLGISGDEHIDLGGDAYIANNYFQFASKDPWTIDTGYSNAISSGDKGSGTTIMVARNVFYELDHAINCKIRTATIFEHNTCVDFHQDWQYNHTVTQDVRCGAVNLFVPNDGNAAGDGAYLAYNILYGNTPSPDDPSPDAAGGFPRLLTWPDLDTTGPKTSVIQLDHNFIDPAIMDTNIGVNHPGGLFAAAHGTGNIQGHPGFVDTAARDFDILPTSPAKGTAHGQIDYGASIGEWVYLLNAPPPLTPATSVNLTVGGPGVVAYKWRLDGGAWSAPVQIGDGGVMARTLPIIRQSVLSLTSLSNGPHVVEVLGRDMAGNWQDADPVRVLAGEPQTAASTVAFTVNTSVAAVQLSEILAADGTGIDKVELHNIGASPLDLSTWALSDDPSGGTLALSGIVPAGGYLTFDVSTLGLLLDRDGDAVFLWQGAVQKDAIIFGPQAAGYTLSRHATTNAWGLGQPTPNAVNVIVGTGSPDGLRITEVLASSEVAFKDDWIEICNLSAVPVLLSGLVLTDNRIGTTGSVIPPHSYAGPNACVKFLAVNDSVPTANHLTFGLDGQQDSVALLTSTGTVLDEVTLFPQTDDFSQTRNATGGTIFAELATPGFSMLTTDPAYVSALAIFRGLRITELMYNAQGGNNFDWIEVRNTGATALNLNGVRFVTGIEFTFGNVMLNPGQNIIVVADVASFRSRYGNGPNVAGTYAGRLDNGGEEVALRLPFPFDANVLCFTYSDAWYPATDGNGKSLEIRNSLDERASWSDRDAWQESPVSGGSPDGATIAEPSGYLAWKAYYGVPSDAMDNDTDGLAPIVEYGLSTSPIVATGTSGVPSLPTATIINGRIALRMNLPANALAGQGHGRSEVTYAVQVTTGLAGAAWTTIATKTFAGSWTGAANVGTPAGGLVPVTVQDSSTMSGTQRHYLRLLVTWTP